MTNLQNNKEIELNENTDFFNTLEKAKLIKNFIDSYTPHMTNNKIMALFGEWGSGKSSVLKYIQKNLDTNIFSTLYFNSWEYEKDQSLALSLFDALYFKVKKRNKYLINFRKNAFRVFGAVIKGWTVPILNLNFKDMLEHVENTEKKNSYYNDVQDFKNSFKELENAILGDESNKRLVVFLDDLDRCEPENILNLLSAIKLFFTLGSDRIIFICGLDKEAVHRALLIKYNDVIKANEYLEKIFDFSFNMPSSFDVEKALRVSLQEFKNDSSDFNYLIKDIASMFKAIEFTNPRHIKKIINKYIIFRYFSLISSIGTEYDILRNLKFQMENIFFILVFFYLIVLYEFEKNEYEDLKKVELKMKSFIDKSEQIIVKDAEIKRNSQNLNLLATRQHNKQYFFDNFIPAMSLLNFEKNKNVISENEKNVEFMKFINFFLPLLPDTVEYSLSSATPSEYLKNLKYLKEFKGYRFSKYIYELSSSNSDKIEPIKILELMEIIDKLS